MMDRKFAHVAVVGSIEGVAPGATFVACERFHIWRSGGGPDYLFVLECVSGSKTKVADQLCRIPSTAFRFIATVSRHDHTEGYGWDRCATEWVVFVGRRLWILRIDSPLHRFENFPVGVEVQVATWTSTDTTDTRPTTGEGQRRKQEGAPSTSAEADK